MSAVGDDVVATLACATAADRDALEREVADLERALHVKRWILRQINEQLAAGPIPVGRVVKAVKVTPAPPANGNGHVADPAGPAGPAGRPLDRVIEERAADARAAFPAKNGHPIQFPVAVVVDPPVVEVAPAAAPPAVAPPAERKKRNFPSREDSRERRLSILRLLRAGSLTVAQVYARLAHADATGQSKKALNIFLCASPHFCKVGTDEFDRIRYGVTKEGLEFLAAAEATAARR